MSALETPPFDACAFRDRSIRPKKSLSVLRVRVSQSTFSIDTSAATGLPSFVMISGSLPAWRAYSARESVARR